MIQHIPAIEKVLYTAKAHTTGGRDGGESRTSDDRLEVKLSVPRLTAAGHKSRAVVRRRFIEACFLSAMKGVAAKKKIALLSDVAVDAEIDLGKAAGGYVIQARLNVGFLGLDREVAESLVESAHQECPYSKATRGNINTVVDVVAAPSVSHVT